MPRTVWPDCGEGSAAACDSFGVGRGVNCIVYCAVTRTTRSTSSHAGYWSGTNTVIIQYSLKPDISVHVIS